VELKTEDKLTQLELKIAEIKGIPFIRSGLMVSALVSGSSGLGSSPDRPGLHLIGQNEIIFIVIGRFVQAR